jgi:predicted nucleic acid-binding Zn ribbon protein
VKQPERIRTILPKVLKNLGVAKRIEEFRAVLLWKKVVGKKIAERSQAVDVNEKTLIVEVDNNVWMQELSLLKPKILKKLTTETGIKDIRFRITRPGRRNGNP